MKRLTPVILLCVAAGAATSATAQAVSDSYANQLIKAALARHPGVAGVTIHAQPPKGSASIVLGSNMLPYGVPATSDALRVQASGQPVQEISADSTQLVSILPLLDVSGDPVGTVSVVSPNTDGGKSAALQEAGMLRDELRRRIVNAANLADPVPYVQNPPSAPYAQQLTNQLMAAHPELLVMALHVSTPAGDDYPIIASSIGRIGKSADGDDMGVIRTGKPAVGAYGANKTRYGIELPMYDAGGKLIGALSVGYSYRPGDDEAALMLKARQLEAEMRARIPSLSRLYGPAI